MASLISFVLSYFIIELLSIFAVMINISKIELNDAEFPTKYFLQTKQFLFTNRIVPYPSYSYLVKTKDLDKMNKIL